MILWLCRKTSFFFGNGKVEENLNQVKYERALLIEAGVFCLLPNVTFLHQDVIPNAAKAPPPLFHIWTYYLPKEFEEAVLLGGVKQKGLRNDHTMGKRYVQVSWMMFPKAFILKF